MPPDPGQPGPAVTPAWWYFTRQVEMFLLGVALVIFSMVEDDAPFLVAGLVIFGIIPIERVLNHFLRDDVCPPEPPLEPLPEPLPTPVEQ